MEHYNRDTADQSVSVPMTLSDLERRDTAAGQNFQADFHNYAQTVWPPSDEICYHVIRQYSDSVYRYQPRPRPRGGAQRLQILGRFGDEISYDNACGE